MSDALPLPPRPSLEQYKKLARDFQQACMSGEPGAVRQWAAGLLETIARLQGIDISQMGRETSRQLEQIDRRWQKFKAAHERASRCLLADAQFFVAREHGFMSWPKFARHIEALARANSPVSNFEAAADAIVSGDAAALGKLLRDHAELARERSTREHRSTLLHYVSANGVEDFRQKTPPNIIEIAKMLIDAGADVNAESDAYGGGCTTLGLVGTSVHPEEAGVQIPLLQTLLDRGARIDAPSAAGNQHSIVNGCLANGQPEAAEFLANRGAPLDLEAAAALGRLPLVQSYFDENGILQGANREQLESAFFYACGCGARPVVEFLLDRGIDPHLRNSDGQTGLHWAGYGPHVGAMELLLRRGASIGVKDEQFGATPLDVVLWQWSRARQSAVRERCYEAVALLARAGATLDPQQWTDPNEVSSLMLEAIRADPRMLAAFHGEYQ